MICSRVRGDNILPQKELHRSLQVVWLLELATPTSGSCILARQSTPDRGLKDLSTTRSSKGPKILARIPNPESPSTQCVRTRVPKNQTLHECLGPESLNTGYSTLGPFGKAQATRAIVFDRFAGPGKSVELRQAAPPLGHRRLERSPVPACVEANN